MCMFRLFIFESFLYVSYFEGSFICCIFDVFVFIYNKESGISLKVYYSIYFILIKNKYNNIFIKL